MTSSLIDSRPDIVLDEAIQGYKDQVKDHLDAANGGKHAKSKGSKGKDDWIPLREADYMSTREYLRSYVLK